MAAATRAVNGPDLLPEKYEAVIVKRIFATFVVMAVVAVFVFGMLHFSPGDPAAIIASVTW